MGVAIAPNKGAAIPSNTYHAPVCQNTATARAAANTTLKIGAGIALVVSQRPAFNEAAYSKHGEEVANCGRPFTGMRVPAGVPFIKPNCVERNASSGVLPA